MLFLDEVAEFYEWNKLFLDSLKVQIRRVYIILRHISIGRLCPRNSMHSTYFVDNCWIGEIDHQVFKQEVIILLSINQEGGKVAYRVGKSTL